MMNALQNVMAVALLVGAVCSGSAREQFAGEFDSVPDNIRSWFKSVHSPLGVPCCDIADGHRTTWRHGDTGYEVPIEGTWVPVPPEAIVYNAGNPLDEAIVWYVKQGSDYFVRCFVPGDGV
jgi:hypothetical protein